MEAQELNLDYFKIYDVKDHRVRYQVALQGQFDEEPEKAELLALSYFANPARKNREEPHDRNAHLTWYWLYQPMPEPTRVVVFENQFGKQKLMIGAARALLAPAQKRERGSRFPKGLDHFKLYWVLKSRPLDQTVAITDQFGREETEVTYPVAFGVPVSKIHLEKDFPFHPDRIEKVPPIYNKRAHLVIYRIEPRKIQEGRVVRDQFAVRHLYFFRSLGLAVPSLKLEWKQV
jgi:hypothetical protein